MTKPLNGQATAEARKYILHESGRIKILAVSPDAILELLRQGTRKSYGVLCGVPADAVIKGVWYDEHSKTMKLRIYSSEFDIIPEAAEIPYLKVQIVQNNSWRCLFPLKFILAKIRETFR